LTEILCGSDTPPLSRGSCTIQTVSGRVHLNHEGVKTSILCEKRFYFELGGEYELDAKEKEFETWKGLVPYLIKRLSISDEDIVQEAYIALWRAVNDFDPNRGAPKCTFYFMRVKTTILNILKKRERRNRIATIENGYAEELWDEDDACHRYCAATPSPEDEITRRVDVSEAVKRLPPRHRRVAELYMELRSVTAVGKELGISPAAASKTLGQIREIWGKA